MSLRLLVSTALCVLVLAGPACSEDAILRANNVVGIGLVGTNIDYLETYKGTKLDSERGNLFGLTGYVSYMDHFAVDNLYLYTSVTGKGPGTHYVGSYQGGTYGDVEGDDGAWVINEDFRLGKGFEFGHAMVTPYLGLGWREWERDIPGSTGYHESYSHGYGGAGAMVQFSPMRRVVLGVHGLVGSTFTAQMTSSQTRGGAFIIPGRYDLGSAMVEMAGIDADYAVDRDLHLTAGLDYMHFDYGQSPVVNGSLEPDSATTELTAKVGVAYAY